MLKLSFGRMIVTDHIAALSDLSKEHLHWLIDVEKRPRTLNDHYYRDYRDKFLAWYKSQRPEYNNLALLDSLKAYDPAAGEGAEQQDTIGVVLSCFNKLGINGLRPTDLAKVLPTDPREAAIAIMASVRAYFQGFDGCLDSVCHTCAHTVLLSGIQALRGQCYHCYR